MEVLWLRETLSDVSFTNLGIPVLFILFITKRCYSGTVGKPKQIRYLCITVPFDSDNPAQRCIYICNRLTNDTFMLQNLIDRHFNM